MSDKDRAFEPLTGSMVKLLSDKLYDKRKGAALDIERLDMKLLIDGEGFFDVGEGGGILRTMMPSSSLLIFRMVKVMVGNDDKAKIIVLAGVLR